MKRTCLVAMLLIGSLLPRWGFAQEPAGGRADDGTWPAGPYSFSDELGGFTITGISGTGSKDDPVEIRQDLLSASPTTMIIRAIKPIRPYSANDPNSATGMIHVRLVTRNSSNLPWVELEYELQEHYGEPSTFGDGLSFDQRKSRASSIDCDRFARYNRDLEPYDRLVFYDGDVDAAQTVTTSFFITDFTPRATFYLKQDPSIPSS